VTLVPHTHWDREWYDPFSVFSKCLLDMMDTLLDLADEGFPHFHLDGQTAMIEDYLAMRPERAEDVRRLVVVPTHVVSSRETGGSPASAVWGLRRL
jgi:alpha-mannosidase